MTTNSASADISLLLGRGDGLAQPQRRFDATPAPFDLDVGDLNNDGLLDVVVIETAQKDEISVAALLNRGDGTFDVQRTSNVNVIGNNGAIRLGDFDEDGVLDVYAAGGWRTAGVLPCCGATVTAPSRCRAWSPDRAERWPATWETLTTTDILTSSTLASMTTRRFRSSWEMVTAPLRIGSLYRVATPRRGCRSLILAARSYCLAEQRNWDHRTDAWMS